MENKFLKLFKLNWRHQSNVEPDKMSGRKTLCSYDLLRRYFMKLDFKLNMVIFVRSNTVLMYDNISLIDLVYFFIKSTIN